MAEKTPLVVDCFQGEDIRDWTEVRGFGIRGVIHKASEGANFRDKVYAMRRDRARKAGLLFGAYHFLNNSDIDQQVANFLEAAQPDVDLLLALDYEENMHRTGSLEQARQFLEKVFAKTGQRPVIYSGNLLKEQLRAPDPFFNQHRLWVAHYTDKPTLPRGWFHYWLHQYTGDGQGPGPHEVPGITTKGLDLNVFGGDDLASEWAPRGGLPLPYNVTTEGDAATELAADDRQPTGPTIGASVKAAYRSRKSGALAAILAVITGGLEKARDAVFSFFDYAPQAVSETQTNLSTAHQLCEWFHVQWHTIELVVVVVSLVVAFSLIGHDKAKAEGKPA